MSLSRSCQLSRPNHRSWVEVLHLRVRQSLVPPADKSNITKFRGKYQLCWFLLPLLRITLWHDYYRKTSCNRYLLRMILQIEQMKNIGFSCEIDQNGCVWWLYLIKTRLYKLRVTLPSRVLRGVYTRPRLPASLGRRWRFLTLPTT